MNHPPYSPDEFSEGRLKSVFIPQTIDAVRQLILQDRHVTYRETETTLGISGSSIHSILHEHLTVKKMASNQGLYAKFVSMMSPKYSIAENDGELMMMALHTQSAIFLGVRTVFWVFTLWFIDDEDASFFHFFHKITNIRS